MKSLVFDSGPLISLAVSSLLPLLSKLKESFKGEFYIPKGVKEEIIDRPLKTKKFCLDAMQIEEMVQQKTVELYDTAQWSSEITLITKLVNSIYSIRGEPLRILHKGELEALVLAKNIEASAVVIDERITRLLLENPYRLRKFLEKKFRGDITINEKKLAEFENHFSSIKVIRSSELAVIACELGLFDRFLDEHSKEEVVHALLWSMKLHGCSITEKEIRIVEKQYRE